MENFGFDFGDIRFFLDGGEDGIWKLKEDAGLSVGLSNVLKRI